MKVILISEALEEPYEMDSSKHGDVYMFGLAVEQKVKAVLETERMRADHDRHGIFGR